MAKTFRFFHRIHDFLKYSPLLVIQNSVLFTSTHFIVLVQYSIDWVLHCKQLWQHCYKSSSLLFLWHSTCSFSFTSNTQRTLVYCAHNATGGDLHWLGRPREVPEDYHIWYDWPLSWLLHANGRSQCGHHRHDQGLVASCHCFALMRRSVSWHAVSDEMQWSEASHCVCVCTCVCVCKMNDLI